jgi:lysozyme family protein
MTDADIIEGVIQREGGAKASADPADRGGLTRYGITKFGLSDMLGHPATDDDIRALTDDSARAFYRWLLVRYNISKIANDQVRMVVTDSAVNLGPTTAISLIQRALKVKDDGVLGPVTLAAIAAADAKALARRELWERARFYASLASRDTALIVFVAGWINRIADIGEALEGS